MDLFFMLMSNITIKGNYISMPPRDWQVLLYLGLLNWEEKDSLQKSVSQLPICVLLHLNKPQANFMEYFTVCTFKCQDISNKADFCSSLFWIGLNRLQFFEKERKTALQNTYWKTTNTIIVLLHLF